MNAFDAKIVKIKTRKKSNEKREVVGSVKIKKIRRLKDRTAVSSCLDGRKA